MNDVEHCKFQGFRSDTNWFLFKLVFFFNSKIRNPQSQSKISSNSYFKKISLWIIVQCFENIFKGSRRLFLLRCNQYFFHRSLNAPPPVELCLNTGGKGDRFNCGSLLGLSGDEL